MIHNDEIPAELFETLQRLEGDGMLAAYGLGKQGLNEARVAKRVCKKHRWRRGKWLCQCRVCGKVTGLWPAAESVAERVARYLNEKGDGVRN